jgi:hypothetical protein
MQQLFHALRRTAWIPAFAGMTKHYSSKEKARKAS